MVVPNISGRPGTSRCPTTANPLPFQERANNVRAHGYATDFLDFTSGHRLAVGNQCERFKQCTRIARRPLLPELLQSDRPCRTFDLNPETGCHFRNRNAPIFIILISSAADRLAYLRLLGRRRSLVHQKASVADQYSAAGRQPAAPPQQNILFLVVHFRMIVLLLSLDSSYRRRSSTASPSSATSRTDEAPAHATAQTLQPVQLRSRSPAAIREWR